MTTRKSKKAPSGSRVKKSQKSTKSKRANLTGGRSGRVVRPKKRRLFVFGGSLVDGPLIDPVRLAKLDLTGDEYNRLVHAISDRNLLRECSCVEEINLGEVNGYPGQSDVYYRYEASSKSQLSAELRTIILDKLGRSKKRL